MSKILKEEKYTIHSTWIPDLIHRLSQEMVKNAASSVRIELHTFDDGDVNVLVGGLLATTLKKGD